MPIDFDASGVGRRGTRFESFCISYFFILFLFFLIFKVNSFLMLIVMI